MSWAFLYPAQYAQAEQANNCMTIKAMITWSLISVHLLRCEVLSWLIRPLYENLESRLTHPAPPAFPFLPCAF